VQQKEIADFCFMFLSSLSFLSCWFCARASSPQVEEIDEENACEHAEGRVGSHSRG